MTKAGELESVRVAIDLKNRMNAALTKYKRLNIIFQEPEPSVPATAKPQDSPAPQTETETEWKFGTDVPEKITVADLELDPTTPQAQLAILRKKMVK